MVMEVEDFSNTTTANPGVTRKPATPRSSTLKHDIIHIFLFEGPNSYRGAKQYE